MNRIGPTVAAILRTVADIATPFGHLLAAMAAVLGIAALIALAVILGSLAGPLLATLAG